jgi:large subunit ribosomal protein L46
LPFTPAPRETEADKTGNIHTLDRQLKTSVFLAIQSTNEGTMSNIPRWTLPSAIATSTDDTLLAVAQRAVTNVAGPNLKIWCPGNAPMAVNLRVYNPKLPTEFRENYYGERIYYYRVQHDSGDVSNDVILSSSSSKSSEAASIAASSKKGKKKKEEEVVVVEEKKGNDISDWGWLSKNEIVERVEGERGKHQAKFFHYML